MSRAFVKEDVDPPERSRRARRSSGLPPGATNYITVGGAQRLRDELRDLCRDSAADQVRVSYLQDLLASVTEVNPGGDSASVAFGAQVTVRDTAGELRRYHIVGVDELEFYPDAISWISPIGKALLAAELGDYVPIENEQRGKVIAVDYPTS